MSKKLYVAEKWFSRGDEGTSTFKVDRKLVEDAITMQTASEEDREEWKENLYEQEEQFPWGVSSMLSEIARSTFIVNRPLFKIEQLDDANGIAVESEETLWGIGATKAAAKEALLRLLANNLDEEGW